MSTSKFHDGYSLADTTDELGKQALKLGLIPSFTVRFFADSREYFIAHDDKSEALTPEEAYLYFKKLVEKAEK
ncbi:hypothetical protein Riv7116_4138 [Rivularia sp. PCC 7116]|uniref:hypothetical protein n=1 Tax=Rivularia sp. PCC 7116 TaxID=373994 RepID=UPI00029F00FE|nr:hypothetical protein [Rivularia sp. PCC 7116]AFY56572.1 hypothetical protein Riv7116_4138 [Rivularia sp. PCC 7116]